MPRIRKPVRVTTVLNWLESHWKEWWWRSVGFEAADKITKESSEFGTKVHLLIEGILTEEVNINIESEVSEEQCAIAVVLWLEQNKVTPAINDNYKDSLEVKVEDAKLNLIGHFDYIAKIDGVVYIIDFKTSNKMRKSFPLQKAAYAKMCGIYANAGITIRSHWNKETNKVDFEVATYPDLKPYWKVFKAALDCYKYFNYTEKQYNLKRFK